MFDDPKKELQMLEEELLRSEEKDEDFERFYSEIYAEFGDQTQNSTAAQPHRTQPRKAPAHTPDSRYVPAPPKKKGIRGLVILACLETLGIVGVVLWWVLKIL